MAGNTKFGIDIIADDKSDAGFASAGKRAQAFVSAEEKRADYLQKKKERGEDRQMRLEDRAERKREKKQREQEKFVSAFEKARQKAEDERVSRAKATGLGASGRGFSAAESAFGGGAISAAFSGKIGAIAYAGGSLKSAFAAANHESAGLAEKLGAVGVAGAAATGVIAGLAIAAYKMASGWTEGGAALGRLSAGIGISTDQLQRWQGAGERFGVDKDTMGTSMGSFASTMNDAKYGRNNTALAAMNQLGLTMKTGGDGNVDVDTMYADAYDAVKRQTNPQTQKQIADILGLGEGVLPAARMGSAVMRSTGADVAKYGGMWSAQDVPDAIRLYGEGVQARQGLDRTAKGLQRGAALGGEGAMMAAIAHDRAVADGSAGRDAGRFLSDGAHTFEAAVGRFGGAVERWAGSFGERIEHLGERSRQDQISPKGAVGVRQMLLGTAREQAGIMGIPWDERRFRTDPAYDRKISDGYSTRLLSRYRGDETMASAAYNAGYGRVDRDVVRYLKDHHGQFSESDFIQDPRYLPRETRDYVKRVGGADRVHVSLEVSGVPGAHLKARSKTGNSVAVAYTSVGMGSTP